MWPSASWKQELCLYVCVPCTVSGVLKDSINADWRNEWLCLNSSTWHLKSTSYWLQPMFLHLVLSPLLLADPQSHLLSHIYLGPLFLMLSLSSVQLLSRVRLFVTPWTAARQASLSITNSRSLLKLMSIESVMPSNISSSVVPFSCPQSFPASGSFQMSQLFASGGQSIRVSASTSVLSMNTQDWSPLGWRTVRRFL